MVISETCQKSKRKSVLASGVGNVVVKFGAKTEERGGHDDGGVLDNSTNEQRTKDGGEWKASSAAVDREEGAMRKVGVLFRIFRFNLILLLYQNNYNNTSRFESSVKSKSFY